MEFKTAPTPGPDGSGSQMFHTESWRSDRVQDAVQTGEAICECRRLEKLMGVFRRGIAPEKQRERSTRAVVEWNRAREKEFSGYFLIIFLKALWR